MDDLTPEGFSALRTLMWGLPSPQDLELAARTIETLFEPVGDDEPLPTPDEVRDFGLHGYADYIKLLRSLASDMQRAVDRIEAAGFEWDFKGQRLDYPKDGSKGGRRSFWTLLVGEAWTRLRTHERNDRGARDAIRDDLLSRRYPPFQCTDAKISARLQAFKRLGIGDSLDA